MGFFDNVKKQLYRNKSGFDKKSEGYNRDFSP